MKDKEGAATPVGCLRFYLSLTLLWLLGLLQLSVLHNMWGEQSLYRLCLFIFGATAGGIIASFVYRGSMATLIHEYKHAILSGLVGNKWKKLKVQGEEGSFQYSYSRETKVYNAFISLAPYFLPLLTFPAILIGLIFYSHPYQIMVGIVGIGYGLDLYMNQHDISPHQSDFSRIRGGYRIGLAFVIGINLVLFTWLATWVLAELEGFVLLWQGLFDYGLYLYGIAMERRS